MPGDMLRLLWFPSDEMVKQEWPAVWSRHEEVQSWQVGGDAHDGQSALEGRSEELTVRIGASGSVSRAERRRTSGCDRGRE